MKDVLISIGAAARACGVPTWRLRGWEEQGLLTPARSAAGYRLYSDADIQRAIQLRSAAAGANRLGLFSPSPAHEVEEPVNRAVASAPTPRQEGRKIRILRRLADAIHHIEDAEHVLGMALDSALALVDADIGALSYADMSTQRYILAASRGLSDAYVRGIDTWRLHEGLAGQSFGLREPLTIQDLDARKDVPRSIVHAEKLRGYVCVPLLRGQRRLGILEVFDREPRWFNTDEVEAIELVAASASAMVDSIITAKELSFLREERARVLREWTSQALTAAETQRADLVGELRREVASLTEMTCEERGPESVAQRLSAFADRVERGSSDWVDLVPLVREQIVRRLSEHTQRRVRLEVGDWPTALPLELTSRLYLLLHSLVDAAVKAAESRVSLQLGGDEATMWVQVCDDRPASPGSDPLHAVGDEVLRTVRGLGGSISGARESSGLTGVRVKLPLSVSQPEHRRLTARERRVLEELAVGSSNRAIAAELGISPKTLQNHLTAIYRKLGVSGRTQALRFLR